MVKGPTALAYVRASSKGSKAETTGSSFKRQQESTAPQAKNSGVLIAKCFKVQTKFKENGVPGTLSVKKRPGFKQLLDWVEEEIRKEKKTAERAKTTLTAFCKPYTIFFFCTAAISKF